MAIIDNADWTKTWTVLDFNHGHVGEGVLLGVPGEAVRRAAGALDHGREVFVSSGCVKSTAIQARANKKKNKKE